MILHLVIGIGLVERGAVELLQGSRGRLRLLRQRFAGIIILRLHIQLFQERQRLLIYRGVVAHHILREGTHFFVLRLLQRQFCRADIDLVGRVGDMRDLGIVWLGALRHRECGAKHERG